MIVETVAIRRVGKWPGQFVPYRGPMVPQRPWASPTRDVQFLIDMRVIAAFQPDFSALVSCSNRINRKLRLRK